MIVRTVVIGTLSLGLGLAVVQQYRPAVFSLPTALHGMPAKHSSMRRYPFPARETSSRQRKVAYGAPATAQPLRTIRSFNARVEAYCRQRLGASTSLMMAFSGGSIRDLKLLYLRLLREEPETAEAENKRKQTLAQVEGLIANYEIGVQECKWGLLNGVAKLPENFR